MYPSRSTFFTPVASLAAATVHGRLILYLPLNETSGTQATDFSGNNHHGRYVNGPQLQGRDGARLDGNHNCIQLPNDLMWNQYSISASIEFIFGIGNTKSNGDDSGYIFATGDPELRTAITPSNCESEAEICTNSPFPRNQWKTIAFVIKSSARRIGLYQDGAYISGRTNNGNIVALGSIRTRATSANYISRSTFHNDKYLAGSVRNFRLWDHALTANEVASLQNSPQNSGGGGSNAEDHVTVALIALNVPNLDNISG